MQLLIPAQAVYKREFSSNDRSLICKMMGLIKQGSVTLYLGGIMIENTIARMTNAVDWRDIT